MSRPAHAAPAPPRFTREEYHRMAEAGLFVDERVELLDGTIVTMSAQSSPHAATVTRLTRLLMRTLGETVHIRPQVPVVLDDWSEPEPDLIVCRPEPRDYARGHPQPEDVYLACEVAVSSLTYDRVEKAAAYARSGIPEYWIVDVESRVVIVLDDPDPATRRYRRERRVEDGATLTAPGGTTLAVADILPRLNSQPPRPMRFAMITFMISFEPA